MARKEADSNAITQNLHDCLADVISAEFQDVLEGEQEVILIDHLH